MQVTIHNATSPRLQKLAGRLQQRQPLLARLGKRAELALRAHFLQRESSPNKKGWPKQHFWSRIRRATALESVDNDRAIIAIADPAFGLKVHGGTVRARPGKALALPLRAAAYGKTPRGLQIEGLFILRSRIAGRAFLAAREGERLTIYYLLVKQTVHRPDPDALPNMEALRADLIAHAERYLSTAA